MTFLASELLPSVLDNFQKEKNRNDLNKFVEQYVSKNSIEVVDMLVAATSKFEGVRWL